MTAKARFPEFLRLSPAQLKIVVAVLVASLAIVVGFLGYVSFVLATLNPNDLRAPLERAFSLSTGRQIELGRLRLNTFDGFGLRTNEVVMRSPRYGLEAQARDVLMEIDLLPLILGRVSIHRITLDRCIIKVKRNQQGRWSVGDLLNRPITSAALSFDPAASAIQLTRSKVRITDESSFPNRYYELTDLDLRYGGSGHADQLQPLSLQSTLEELGQKTVLALEGTVHIPNQAADTWRGDLQILIADLQPQNWESYWQPWVRTQKLNGLLGLDTGRLDINLHWKSMSDGTANLLGQVGVKSLIWNWPEVWGQQPWATPALIAKVDVTQNNGTWQAKAATFTVGALQLTVQGSINTLNETVDVNASTNEFDPYLARGKLPLQFINATTKYRKPLEPWLRDSTGKGNIKVSIQTMGTLQNLVTTGAVNLLGLSLKTPLMGNGIDSLTGQLVFERPGEVQFKAVKLGLAQTTCTLDGSLAEDQWQLAVTAPTLDLGHLRSLSTPLFPQLVGQWDGQGSLQGTLVGDVRNPSFAGTLNLLGANFQDRRLPRALTDITGALVFAPDLVTLKAIHGQVEGREVNITGSVQRPGQYDAAPDLVLQSESLDLATVRALLTSPLVGGALRSTANALTQLNGTASGTITIQDNQLGGQLRLQGVTVGLATLGLPLSDVHGTALLRDGGVELKNLEGSTAGSGFRFDGTLNQFSGSPTLSGNLAANLTFPNALRLLPPSIATHLDAQGTAAVTVNFSPSADGTQVQAQGDFSGVTGARIDGLNLSGNQLGQATLTALAQPSALELQAGQLTLGSSELRLSGMVRRWLSSRASLAVNLSGEMTSLGELAHSFPWLGDLASASSGQGQIQLSLSGNPKNSFWSGGVRLDDVQTVAGLTLNGTLTQQGQTIKTANLAVLWHDQPLQIKGSYTPGPNPQVTFQAQADTLDLTRLLTEYQQISALRAWRGQGKLAVGSTQINQLALANLSTTLILAGDSLRLDNLKAFTGKGSLVGNLVADVTSNIPAYSGNWDLRRVNLGQVSQGLLGWGDARLGTGDLQVQFSAQGGNSLAFLSSLSGSGQITTPVPVAWLPLLAQATGIAEFAQLGRMTTPFTFSDGLVQFANATVTSFGGWQGLVTGQTSILNGQTSLTGTISTAQQNFRIRLKGSVSEATPGLIQEIKAESPLDLTPSTVP